jgi:hypothetical protein
MAEQVCMGGLMKCSFGVAPGSLIVLPTHRTMTGKPAANIMDNKPMVNIPPFGMCQSLANPTVAAATAAALGVLTPMPCIPNTPAPWVVGAPTVLLDGAPALNKTSTLMCAWGGVIQINFAGQVNVQIP